MASRRAADDRPGGSAPCRALANRSVARGESETNETDGRGNLKNLHSHSTIPLDIKLHSPPDVAGTLSRQPLSDPTGATDIQIRALHARPRLARHAQLLSSSHTVDMADMGSLQRPKDHAGYGSQADSGLPLGPGISSQHLLSSSLSLSSPGGSCGNQLHPSLLARTKSCPAQTVQLQRLTEFSVNLLSYW